MRIFFGLALLGLSSTLAAQDRKLPQPADDALELVVFAHGSAPIEAQGYRVIGYGTSLGGPQANENGHDAQAARDALGWAGSLPHAPCAVGGGEAGAYGPFGNELEIGADEGDALGNAAIADDGDPVASGASGAGEGWTVYAPIPSYYQRNFPDLESAEAAVSVLTGQGFTATSIMSLAYDCSVGNHAARLEALRASREQVDELAREMGLRVAGATRAEFINDQQSTFYQILAEMNSGADTQLQSTATARVTYVLTR